MGRSSEHRLIDQERLRDLLGPALRDEFDAAYRREIADAITTRRLQREPWWTLAVGDEDGRDLRYGTTAEPVEL